MKTTKIYTSTTPKNPDAFTGEQKTYWVEIQLVNEQGIAVANMPWKAENRASAEGLEKELQGKSDDTGLIRIEPRYGSELKLVIDSQSLSAEMEKRFLRISRDPHDSEVRKDAEENGYLWHYAVIGELCDKAPSIELRKNEGLPTFLMEKCLKG